MNFIPIQYGAAAYPSHIKCEIKEIAGHFDKDAIACAGAFSLHTEYSYGKRAFSGALIGKFDELKSAQKDGVPQLWRSAKWAEQFADFIFELVATNGANSSTNLGVSKISNGENSTSLSNSNSVNFNAKNSANDLNLNGAKPHAPAIIEIHPPFNDYCDLDEFFAHYERFERKIHAEFDSQILIENRVGTLYRGGRFLVQKASEIAALCERIAKNGVNLGVVLDFPQLLTAEKIDTTRFDKAKFKAALDALQPYAAQVSGIHIWGKKKNRAGRWVAHCGDFDAFFEGNADSRDFFVAQIKQFCDDGRARYFVPEVNSGEKDLREIVKYFFEI